MRRLAPSIAHQNAVDNGREQIVQPLRLRAFLERDVNGAAHAAEALDDRARVGRDDRARDHAPGLLAHGGHRGCLVHIEADILVVRFLSFMRAPPCCCGPWFLDNSMVAVRGALSISVRLGVVGYGALSF